MPLRHLHIQDVVVKRGDLLQILVELFLEIEQVVSVGRALDTAEDRHDLVLALPSELQLALADLIQFAAPLDERVILGEDRLILVQMPVLVRTVLLDEALLLPANLGPLLAAFDRLGKVIHALLDLALNHVLDLDLVLAALDDLV
jgi:hypothetical protein